MLVRADASAAIGTGHVMRCLALAIAWQQAGGRVSWLMAEALPALEERLAHEGIVISRTAVVPGSGEDAQLVIAAAQRCKAVWTVVDGYRFGPDYIRRLKEAGLRVLFLDDDGRFDFYAADIVLNQNAAATAELYEQRGVSTCFLLGLEYVLLRPEFLAERGARKHLKFGRKVLITMGGSDPENLTAKALHAISRCSNECEARVVVGAGNPWTGELRSLAGQLTPQVQLQVNPPNMAQLMSWADVAISGAGSTCWELAYMGLPAIVIALSNDQVAVADGVARNGIGVSLGWHANLSEETMAEVLLDLLRDHERRVAMGARGQRLVDGRGAERVVAFLQRDI